MNDEVLRFDEADFMPANDDATLIRKIRDAVSRNHVPGKYD